MSAYEQLFRQLDEVGTLSRGKSKHRPRNDPILYGGPHPFIQTGDVKHSTFYVTSYSQTYSDKGLAQSKLWPAGTLCITIAANIADTAILAFPACFPDSIIGFTAKDGVASTAYVKYCLDTYKTQMRSISQGTTQDNLSQGKLLSLKFRIPDFQVQQKIAAILSAYDDLIANNQRRITLLERMAEDIYREWFVRLRFPGHKQGKLEKGLPQGWRVAALGQIFKTSSGGTPSRTEHANFDGDIPWIKTGELKTTFALGSEETLTRRGVENSAAKVYKKHTVVMAMYCAMPDLSVIANDAATNQACCAFIPHDSAIHHSFCFFLIKFAQLQLVMFAHGAAQQNLSQEIIKRFPVLLPSKHLISAFGERVGPLFDSIEALMRANVQLKATRIALLPRLISGKLAVDALGIRFPPGMSLADKINL